MCVCVCVCVCVFCALFVWIIKCTMHGTFITVMSVLIRCRTSDSYKNRTLNAVRIGHKSFFARNCHTEHQE